MVSQLTSEKWGYHQYLIELQFYPTESFKSFDISEKIAERFLSKARTWQPIEAGGARPQGDGREEQKEVGPWLIDANYQTLTFGKGGVLTLCTIAHFLKRENGILIM